MKIRLDYDKEGLEVEVPDKNIERILEMKSLPAVLKPQEAIKRALTNPSGSPPLTDIARGRKSACIVISDKTRPVPNKVILPGLLETLEDSGTKRGEITILIATGMHAPVEERELVELVGKDIAANYRIVNHLARKDEAHTFLGETSSGIPAYINSIYCSSDLKILTGFIEPHLMAGFSGGRKSICPGISSVKTLRIYHGPRLVESPLSTPGILEGNPCHEEALEIAKMAGVDFILNVTLNSEKKITGIFAGDLEEAHMIGAQFCKEQVSDCVREPVDIVITSGGGYPLDHDFYQTVKGMVGALEVVKKGGTIIVVSGCRDGIGSPEFEKLLLEMKDMDSFMRMISREDYFCIDQWEVEELIKVLKKARIKLFSSGLNTEEITRCHVSPLTDIDRGIAESIEEYGNDARIAVIPHGPYSLVGTESS